MKNLYIYILSIYIKMKNMFITGKYPLRTSKFILLLKSIYIYIQIKQK